MTTHNEQLHTAHAMKIYTTALIELSNGSRKGQGSSTG